MRFIPSLLSMKSRGVVTLVLDFILLMTFIMWLGDQGYLASAVMASIGTGLMYTIYQWLDEEEEY